MKSIITESDENNKDEPIAAWEALLLPNWRWEALEKKEDGRYFGRVKSPMTYDRWEYGYFSEEQLKTAGAYRVDVDIDEDDEPLFPDGGYRLSEVYETELDALGYKESDDSSEE